MDSRPDGGLSLLLLPLLPSAPTATSVSPSTPTPPLPTEAADPEDPSAGHNAPPKKPVPAPLTLPAAMGKMDDRYAAARADEDLGGEAGLALAGGGGADAADDAAAWRPATQARLQARRALHTASSLGRRVLFPLRPRAAAPEKQLRPTAYLDGLRGFAAFLVYWHHHQLWAHEGSGQAKFFENGFAYEGNWHFAALPVVRFLFMGGHFAVSTFFVISGYVLASKPLALVHERDFARLGDNVGSALFRRWLRLYLPFMATTFVYMTCWHLFDLWICERPKEPTWAAEVVKWYVELKKLSFVFSTGGKPWFWYNFHLWSIPVEFKGSLTVYTALLAFSRFSRNGRLCSTLALIFYFMYVADGWYCAMFLAGMLLCDLDLLARRHQLPQALARLAPAKDFIFYHLLAASLWLGGVPEAERDMDVLRGTRGWYYLSFLKPQAFYDYKWFYLLWAATFLVAAIPRVPRLRAFFETRFCQDLGHISFSLYLVHGPVLWTLGDRLYTAVGYHQETQLLNLAAWADRLPLPKAGPLGLEVAFLAPHLILLPLTLWLAGVVTRLIDEPSVRFTQWLYAQMLPDPAELPTRATKE